MSDEPDRVEQLRRDAVAVCGEYFTVAGEAAAPCPGCLAREYERRDLVAEFTIANLRATLRQMADARIDEQRARARERQGSLL